LPIATNVSFMSPLNSGAALCRDDGACLCRLRRRAPERSSLQRRELLIDTCFGLRLHGMQVSCWIRAEALHSEWTIQLH
jgi:hypothetical protein